MDIKTQITNIARGAQEAFRASLGLTTQVKNKALKEMADALVHNKVNIMHENHKDLKNAVRLKMPLAFIDRLNLTEKTISQMSESLREIAALPDPIGETIKSWRRPNGLFIKKVRVPIGVIAIIYESRPNVTSDCIGLCFKSGNSVILRGGSEALNSNLCIYKTLKAVLHKNKISDGLVNMVGTRDRKAIDVLVKLNDYIDLIMPRGGEGLIKKVVKLSHIPVIKHYKGVCYVYVDKETDLKKAVEICYNAKVQRPGVCNAMEGMLVHKDIAAKFLPLIAERFEAVGVQMRGCVLTQRIIKGVRRATEKDYRTEYLDLILSVKVVKDLSEGIRHINTYGSHHSDTIVTEDGKAALEFLKYVDSACVYQNASTRFTDGNQFGLGAEIGISTDKLHARGPVGLEELTTYKYTVFGTGQVRK